MSQKAIPSTILQDTENYNFITLKNEINRLSEIAQTIYNNKIDITKLKNNNIKKINKIYSEIYINPNINFLRKIKYVLFN